MKKLLIISFLSLILFSCQEEKDKSKKQGILHTSTGRTYELLVVAKNNVWDSSLGDTIKTYIGQTAPWLFSKEPYFDISRIEPKNFGDLYKMYRNILVIDIDSKYKTTKLNLSNNVFAKPQKIVKLLSPDKASAQIAFKTKFQSIIDNFQENEVIRVTNVYKGLNTKSISKTLQDNYGVYILAPKGFYIASQKEDFVWLRKQARDIEEGIMIYKRPYLNQNQFDIERILEYRNVITEREIPGPIDSSYMQVADIFPHYVKEVEFNSKYAVLIRSWWETTKYPMGGPFMSYSFVDENQENIITIDGYIYAPKKDKRDILIHIEAILKSFKFAEKEVVQKEQTQAK